MPRRSPPTTTPHPHLQPSPHPRMPHPYSRQCNGSKTTHPFPSARPHRRSGRRPSTSPTRLRRRRSSMRAPNLLVSSNGPSMLVPTRRAKTARRHRPQTRRGGRSRRRQEARPTLTLNLPRASLAVQRIHREFGGVAHHGGPYEKAPPTADPAAPTIGRAHASATSTTESPAAVQRASVLEPLAVSSDQAGPMLDGVGLTRALRSSDRPVQRVVDPSAMSQSQIDRPPRVVGVATVPTLGVSRILAPTLSPGAPQPDSGVQRIDADVATALPQVGLTAHATVQRAPVRQMSAPNTRVGVGLTAYSPADSTGSRYFAPGVSAPAQDAVQRAPHVRPGAHTTVQRVHPIRGLSAPNTPVAVGLTAHSRSESTGSRSFSPRVCTQAHVTCNARPHRSRQPSRRMSRRQYPTPQSRSNRTQAATGADRRPRRAARAGCRRTGPQALRPDRPQAQGRAPARPRTRRLRTRPAPLTQTATERPQHLKGRRRDHRRHRPRRERVFRRHDRQHEPRCVQQLRGPRLRGRDGATRGGWQQRLRLAAADPDQVLQHQAQPAGHQGHREGRQMVRQHRDRGANARPGRSRR